jgi:hypothetical protein
MADQPPDTRNDDEKFWDKYYADQERYMAERHKDGFTQAESDAEIRAWRATVNPNKESTMADNEPITNGQEYVRRLAAHSAPPTPATGERIRQIQTGGDYVQRAGDGAAQDTQTAQQTTSVKRALTHTL